MDTQFLSKSGFQRDELKRVWMHPGSSQIDYSDGDSVEARLLRILSAASDVSCASEELRRSITDWPSQYHFSMSRGTLLRPIAPRLAGQSVLEIGAGCGAISRFLGETGCEVVAIEGSLRRAEIAAERCRDLSNVQILNAYSGDLPSKLFRTFDVVTLIGVLEYARVWPLQSKELSPERALLELAKSFLKPDGVLLLAIENKHGVKYFAGAPEDHLSRPYFGIADLYDSKSPATWGLEELRGLLAESGFSRQEVALPFPDYKLPSTILNAEAEKWSFQEVLKAAAHTLSDDPQAPGVWNFPPSPTYRGLAKSGLAAQTANSFFMIAHNRSSNSHWLPKQVGWHYSLNRFPEFRTETHFQCSDSNSLVVSKKRLAPSLPLKRGLIGMELVENSPFYSDGELHTEKLTRILAQPNWTIEALTTWTKEWLRALMNEAKLSSTTIDWDAKLPGNLLDATPFNLMFFPDQSAKFFDLEWSWQESIPLKSLFFRGLLNSLNRVSAAVSTEVPLPLVVEIILSIAKKLNCTLNLPELQTVHFAFEQQVQQNSSGAQIEWMPTRSLILKPLAANHWAHLTPPKSRVLVESRQRDGTAKVISEFPIQAHFHDGHTALILVPLEQIKTIFRRDECAELVWIPTESSCSLCTIDRIESERGGHTWHPRNALQASSQSAFFLNEPARIVVNGPFEGARWLRMQVRVDAVDSDGLQSCLSTFEVSTRPWQKIKKLYRSVVRGSPKN